MSEDFDETSYVREAAAIIRRYSDVPLEELQVGRVVLEVMQIAASYGIRLPTNLTMLGKTLLNLDKIGRTLAPEFDPTAAVKRYSAEIIKKQMSEESYTKNLYDALLDTKEFITFLPSRINKILETISENKLSLNVDAINERYLMIGLQKIANRLTLGMILAAMIMAASLLMRVETTFQLFGYPGIAIIFFLFAAIGGLILIFKILLHDESAKK